MKVEIVADENISTFLVRPIRARGVAVLWVPEVMPGHDDPDVLEITV
jgi:hypothetical protein